MDVLLVGFIVGFIVGGWATGFLRRLAGLGFIAISFVLSVYGSKPFGDLIHGWFPDVTPAYAELWAYLLIFPAVLVALHLLVGRLLKNVAVGGVSREVDRALGAILGAIEAVLILSVVVIAIDRYSVQVATSTIGSIRPLMDVLQSISTSTTARLLRETTVPLVLAIIGPLLPRDVSSLLDKLPNGTRGGIPGLPGFPFPSP
jgi:uncharacterized membrane protein required for colicin V production